MTIFKKHIYGKKIIIVRALTYYKIDSFSLFILEVTNKDNVLSPASRRGVNNFT